MIICINRILYIHKAVQLWGATVGGGSQHVQMGEDEYRRFADQNPSLTFPFWIETYDNNGKQSFQIVHQQKVKQ